MVCFRLDFVWIHEHSIYYQYRLSSIRECYVSALERGEKLPKLKTFIRTANTLQAYSDILLSDVLTIKNQIVVFDLSQKLSKLPLPEQKRTLNVLYSIIVDSEE